MNKIGDNMDKIKATTIVAIKKGNNVAIAGDGQVTFGETVFKSKAKKIRKIKDYNVLTGFAGGAADAFALFEKFENHLDSYKGNLKKAAVELAKEWRNDKALRVLDAMLCHFSILLQAQPLLFLNFLYKHQDVLQIFQKGQRHLLPLLQNL